MTGLLTFSEWADYAIEVLCSNEKCNRAVIIDSRQISGLIYCSRKCVGEIKNG